MKLKPLRQAMITVAYTCAGIQVAALLAIAPTYVINSYKPVDECVFISFTAMKNLWVNRLSRFITGWSEADGFVAPFMANIGLKTALCPLDMIFWWRGKILGHRTRDSKIHGFS